MFSAKHSPEASKTLGVTVHLWSDQLLEIIGDGQRRGEVRLGSLERIALPIFAALHGYTGLTVSGMLPPEAAGYGLDDLIAPSLAAAPHVRAAQGQQRSRRPGAERASGRMGSPFRLPPAPCREWRLATREPKDRPESHTVASRSEWFVRSRKSMTASRLFSRQAILFSTTRSSRASSSASVRLHSSG